MDLSLLPTYEIRAAFATRLPAAFEAWVSDRSAEIVQATRRVYADAQRSSPSGNDIDITNAAIINNILGYAKNLEILHINLSGLTLRLKAHNNGLTTAQVQQLDGWRTTVSCLFISIILFFPQDIIDAIS